MGNFPKTSSVNAILEADGAIPDRTRIALTKQWKALAGLVKKTKADNQGSLEELLSCAIATKNDFEALKSVASDKRIVGGFLSVVEDKRKWARQCIFKMESNFAGVLANTNVYADTINQKNRDVDKILKAVKSDDADINNGSVHIYKLLKKNIDNLEEAASKVEAMVSDIAKVEKSLDDLEDLGILDSDVADKFRDSRRDLKALEKDRAARKTKVDSELGRLRRIEKVVKLDVASTIDACVQLEMYIQDNLVSEVGGLKDVIKEGNKFITQARSDIDTLYPSPPDPKITVAALGKKRDGLQDIKFKLRNLGHEPNKVIRDLQRCYSAAKTDLANIQSKLDGSASEERTISEAIAKQNFDLLRAKQGIAELVQNSPSFVQDKEKLLKAAEARHEEYQAEYLKRTR